MNSNSWKWITPTAILLSVLAAVVLNWPQHKDRITQPRSTVRPPYDYNPCPEKAKITSPDGKRTVYICDTQKGWAGYVEIKDGGTAILFSTQVLADLDRYERFDHLRQTGLFKSPCNGREDWGQMVKSPNDGRWYVKVCKDRVPYPGGQYDNQWFGLDTDEGRACWNQVQDLAKTKGPPF